MFEKKVTGALRSPTLITSAKQYQQHLTRETKRRGWLVILVGLLVCFQFVPLFLTPPTPAVADASATLSSGVSSKQDALVAYDNQNSLFNHVASSLSLQRSDIYSLRPSSTAHAASDGIQVEWTSLPTYRSSFASNQATPGPVFALKTAPGDKIVYGYGVVNLKKVAQKTDILIGRSEKIGQFAVVKASGNIITSWQAAKDRDSCFKSPSTLSLSYLNCKNGVNVKTTTKVYNLTQNRDTRYTKTRSGDLIEYRLRVTNNSFHPIRLTPELYVGDITQYAQLVDTKKAHFDRQSQQLTWPSDSIVPTGSTSYRFQARIAPAIALTAYNHQNLNSYDCRLTTFFGNTHSVSLLCPGAKNIERFLSQLASRLVIGLLLVLFVASVYFYLRSLVLKKEMRLILEDITGEEGLK